MAVAHQEILLLGHFTNRFQLADRQMAAADPAGVTLSDLYGIGRAIGLFVRIPATAFILLLAAICTVRAAPSRFKRAFDLDGLMREQATSFPAGAAHVARHLRLVSPASAEPRPADFALTPEEWLERFGRRQDGSFDQAAAHDALRDQLGPRWTEPEAAEPAVRCLFTAFALHMAERRDEALQLLGTLAAGLGDQAEDRAEGPDKPLALDRAVVARADTILSGMDAEHAARCGVPSRLHEPGADGAARRGPPASRCPGACAIRLAQAGRPSPLVCLAFARVRDGRVRALPASQSPCRGDRRTGSLGGRTRRGRAVIEPNLSRAVEALRKAAGAAPRA